MNELWLSAWKWIYEKALAALTQPAGGVGIVEELGSGYSVTEEQMANAAKLKALCDEAVLNPGWVAHDITGDGVAETFCNRAAQFIAQGMGYFSFRRDQSADDMLAAMSVDSAWREELELDRIAPLALKGALVLICLEDHPHGHVVAAAPQEAEDSGSWGRKVPMVAQVGTAKIGNGIKRLSAAFRLADSPRLRFFILEDSIA